jgi:hypothetical protein
VLLSRWKPVTKVSCTTNGPANECYNLAALWYVLCAGARYWVPPLAWWWGLWPLWCAGHLGQLSTAATDHWATGLFQPRSTRIPQPRMPYRYR